MNLEQASLRRAEPARLEEILETIAERVERGTLAEPHHDDAEMLEALAAEVVILQQALSRGGLPR